MGDFWTLTVLLGKGFLKVLLDPTLFIVPACGQMGGNDRLGRCAAGWIFLGLPPWAYASPFSEFDALPGEKTGIGACSHYTRIDLWQLGEVGSFVFRDFH